MTSLVIFLLVSQTVSLPEDIVVVPLDGAVVFSQSQSFFSQTAKGLIQLDSDKVTIEFFGNNGSSSGTQEGVEDDISLI